MNGFSIRTAILELDHEAQAITSEDQDILDTITEVLE